MTKRQYIVLKGDLEFGFEFVGPFPNQHAAAEYSSRMYDNESLVAQLYPPVEDDDE